MGVDAVAVLKFQKGQSELAACLADGAGTIWDN